MPVETFFATRDKNVLPIMGPFVPSLTVIPVADYSRIRRGSDTQKIRRPSEEVRKESEFRGINRPSEDASLREWSSYFDKYWEEEGLAEDWYNLKNQLSTRRVGFVIGREMASLRDIYDERHVEDWRIRAGRNLAGYEVEFLSDDIVYPRQYYRSRFNPRLLVDPFYGSEAKTAEQDAKRDIEALVSSEERDGAVKNAIGEIKRFLLSAPVDSMTVMVSPLGPTGFKPEEGLGRDYEDSYIMIALNNEKGKTMHYTIKTDFTLEECRAFIFELTGKKLHPGASMAEYVESIAKIKPGASKGIKNVFDIIKIMQKIHPDDPFTNKQTGKKTSWAEVEESIKDGEAIYEAQRRRRKFINKFKEFGEEDVLNSHEEAHKALAAALILMGDDFVTERELEALHKSGRTLQLGKEIELKVKPMRPYAVTINEMAKTGGCSSGEIIDTVITTGGERIAVNGGDRKCFECGQDSKDKHYHCNGCGKRYDDETNVDRDKRTQECKNPSCTTKFNC